MAGVLRQAQSRGVRVFALATGVLEKIADAQTPSTIARHRSTARCVALGELVVSGLVLVLHDVRDPGNAGTIIRSADAAGVSAVIFSGQSVDPFNPKTLRASAGSVFHVPVCVSPLEDALAYFSAAGARTLATVVRGGDESPRAGFLGADGGRHRQRGRPGWTTRVSPGVTLGSPFPWRVEVSHSTPALRRR